MYISVTTKTWDADPHQPPLMASLLLDWYTSSPGRPIFSSKGRSPWVCLARSRYQMWNPKPTSQMRRTFYDFLLTLDKNDGFEMFQDKLERCMAETKYTQRTTQVGIGKLSTHHHGKLWRCIVCLYKVQVCFQKNFVRVFTNKIQPKSIETLSIKFR